LANVLVDLDGLAEAAKLLGAASETDTVNAALREVVRRAAAVARMRAMVAEGVVDFSVLEK
jgi:hypothetical protein